MQTRVWVLTKHEKHVDLAINTHTYISPFEYFLLRLSVCIFIVKRPQTVELGVLQKCNIERLEPCSSYIHA